MGIWISDRWLADAGLEGPVEATILARKNISAEFAGVSIMDEVWLASFAISDLWPINRFFELKEIGEALMARNSEASANDSKGLAHEQSNNVTTAAGRDPRLKRRMSRRRRMIFICLSALFGLSIAGTMSECVFRILEGRERAHEILEGTGFQSVDHERWGWALRRGSYRFSSAEFDTRGFVNELYMNDGEEFEPEADKACVRVLALGDSHTAAVGASANETWVKVIERLLNESGSDVKFCCHNAAAPGYSLHQYLVRLQDQGPVVRPDYVVIGYSFATDLYDLLPPERGGWIYGGDKPRVYFDLDKEGELVEKYWTNVASIESPKKRLLAVSIRNVLGSFATFRYLRRSKLALAIGAKVRIGDHGLWPNMEIVLERKISHDHRYQWDLTYALLKRLKKESNKLGAKLIVIGIPYLPQVYDEIWDVTFGADERMSRTAAPDRLFQWCKDHDIAYVETLSAFRESAKAQGRWLHHRKDAHPTPEGHELIARTVLASDLIRPNDTGIHGKHPH